MWSSLFNPSCGWGATAVTDENALVLLDVVLAVNDVVGLIRGWPTFAISAKVGTHEACVRDFPYRTADSIVPTFTT